MIEKLQHRSPLEWAEEISKRLKYIAIRIAILSQEKFNFDYMAQEEKHKLWEEKTELAKLQKKLEELGLKN